MSASAFYKITEFKSESNTFVLNNNATGVDHRFYVPSIMSLEDKFNGVDPATYVDKTVKMSYSVPLIEIAVDACIVN